ncbi:hypothetical protein B9N56_06500 [Finegoldia magna]|uniref:Radical SAM core domain-containing protein n=1 Tax=Finegoldia magna TaxID=1260 RepID=A0A233VY63_FINMA|nr:radical SAM protein [Finegoldia magna]OXZ37338.1 hypothetical protein B9N56_06500 [Finegoldia magna]
MINHYLGNQIYSKCKEETLIFSEEQTKMVEMHLKGFSEEKILKEIFPKSTDKEIEDNIEQFKSILYNIINMCDLYHDKPTGEKGKWYPMVINLEMTNKCNFNCPFCYKNASLSKNDFIEEEIIQFICNNLENKVNVLHLTGGEPLIYPNINNIIAKLSRKFRVNITSNFSLHNNLDDETLKKVNSLQISLYGYDKNSYVNNIHSDYFSNVYDGIRRLENLGINYYFMIVATEFVYKNIDKYKKFLDQFDKSKIKIENYNNVGRFKNKDLYDYKSKIMDNLKLDIINSEFDVEKKSFEDNLNLPLKCGAGVKHITISEKGKVYPCIDLERCENIGVEFNEYKHYLKNGQIYNFLSQNFEFNEEDIAICNEYFEKTRQFYEK